MKRSFLVSLFAIILFANAALGQEIPQSQVPSLIINNFQKSFSKVFDVEWELDGENYKVEFETSLFGPDHNVWYDKTGKQIRHKEEITKNDLPQKVLATISTTFNGFRIDDVKKITEGGKVIYTLELESRTEEWKVTFDAGGNILSKIAD